MKTLLLIAVGLFSVSLPAQDPDWLSADCNNAYAVANGKGHWLVLKSDAESGAACLVPTESGEKKKDPWGTVHAWQVTEKGERRDWKYLKHLAGVPSDETHVGKKSVIFSGDHGGSASAWHDQSFAQYSLPELNPLATLEWNYNSSTCEGTITLVVKGETHKYHGADGCKRISVNLQTPKEIDAFPNGLAEKIDKKP